MKSETFDVTEARGIRAALSGYEARCLQALETARGAHGRPPDATMARDMYRSLKEELKAEAAVLRARQLSRAEHCFYEPAIRQAAQEFQAPADSSPHSPRWSISLIGACGEFAYYLHNLNKAQTK